VPHLPVPPYRRRDGGLFQHCMMRHRNVQEKVQETGNGPALTGTECCRKLYPVYSSGGRQFGGDRTVSMALVQSGSCVRSMLFP
jgi:hypothetical protein